MKKSLSLLLAALLLPLAMGAQMLAPSRLADNQMIVGHYTSDALATSGWGRSMLKGDNTVATDLTPDELAVVQGAKIVAFRVGLFSSTPVTRVFAMPRYANGTFGEMTSWECNVSAAGWNLIEIDDPYLINLPGDAQLRIGFDYYQDGSTGTPISAVQEGTVYPSYHYRNGNWINLGVNTKGNLSLQLIVESDNFSPYVIRTRNLTVLKSTVITGEDVPFNFETCNLGVGNVEAGGCTFAVAIDGEVVDYITNPQPLTNEYTTITGSTSTTGLPASVHTLTVTPVSVNGEAIQAPIALSATFKNFDEGFSRQMRLVEQFTSTYCTHCPKGVAALQALSDMRGDIAWVGVHQNMGSADVFRTAQCDSICDLQGCDGYPEASFDRTTGIENANSVIAVISYTNATAGANFFNSFLESINDEPACATVNINSTYDPDTRKAVITVDGQLVANFDQLMGTDSKLTVYITEDGLVAPQLNNGVWENEYVHNGVLRKAIGSVKGMNIKRVGDNAYKNEFTVNIPTAWNADNLNIIAFISRPLGNPVSDIYVTNANKRKLGEFDVPAVTPGDLNNDGEIDVADVSMLIACVLNDNAAGIDMSVIDINNDGNLDVADVTQLISIVLGK